jgi:uncharacterized protein with HEPN domain
MDNQKDDDYYIKKVLENIDAILNYNFNVSYEEFSENDLLLDATMFKLIQMVENINHISKEFKEKHNKMKWGLIVGFRNGIVHDYGKFDYTVVYEIITYDLVELKKELLP